MRALSMLACMMVLVLAGCPGSLATLLPPGAGPGVYAGEFTSALDDSVLGNFSLTIDNVGTASGNGLLRGASVELSGTFSAGVVDGLITDTVTQLSGRFDGELIGATLSGDFRLPQAGGEDDLLGNWDAAPQS